ncbi:uncharacterized protein LOC114355161 [Ostrinia furnacalis]|uniref:uncharacterized protein LOC114355161 n=1 Tax=Ostrinia furnacalis TaxID=93504 RepID=UPI00103E4525|nr:uncharacterized protein LOC114355161 [Ostrinia furnacalis]
MWLQVVLLGLFFPSAILGLDQRAVEFSVDYFRHRNAKFVCLLTCGDDTWNRNFVKLAAKHHARVSVSKIDQSISKLSLGSCLQQKFFSVGVLVDPTCPKFKQVMDYASQNALLDSRHQWLIINTDDNYTVINNDYAKNWTSSNVRTMLDIIGNLNISVDTDITLTIQGVNSFEIFELFNYGKIQGGDLNIIKAGSWSAENGIMTNLNEYKYYRRWNFHHWPLRFIVVVAKPEQFDLDRLLLADRRQTPGVATMLKTGTIILNVLAEIHNISFNYSIADRWIGEFNEKNISKMAAATSLYNKHQDLTPILRWENVIDKVDLVHPPVTSIETRYFYRIPTYGAGKFENQFLRPLSYGSWISVVIVITLCACVLLISAKLERRRSAGQYAIFSVLASMCQQFFEDNTSFTPRVSAARQLTIFVTGISCVLIYNYYTSSVVSWLLNGPPPSINSLQELLESPLELIFEDIGYTRSWLQKKSYYYNIRNIEIEDELRKKKVFNKKPNAPLLVPVEEGIKLVKAGGYAYHTDTNNANRLISQTFTQSELCELGSLQSMAKAELYPALQRNSPYKEFFVWGSIRLYERGIVKFVQRRISSPAVECEGSSPRALALGGAAPAFLLLAAGYLLATVIMLVERAIWRRKYKSKVVLKLKM